ncbi:BfmA/BtgA family mobilization protein [Rasiella sp. SM2506]|uniref:BfmA/BtgA family mobilization protein n=1 Tax=Rasiella sp. SM2506 TaxID=3423914 RepID=UPI003D798724
MDKGYEKERFQSLGIKSSVAKKFKKYCRSISKSQSMTLLLMLDFFEKNGLSPEDDLKPNLKATENLFKKRINALIAIIKDIEKTQTKPTLAMLQSLFEVAEPKKKPLILEKKYFKEKLNNDTQEN